MLSIEQHVPWLSLRAPLRAAGAVIALASWVGVCFAGCDGPRESQPQAHDAGSGPSHNEDTLLVDARAALRLGDYTALPELIERLDLAAATDPNDGPRVLYAALIRSWRMAEGIDHIPGYLPGDYGADHGIAIEYFLRARMLLPDDARVPVFMSLLHAAWARGPVSAAMARELGNSQRVDPQLIDLGRSVIDEVREHVPTFALPMRALDMGELPRDDPAFAQAVGNVRDSIAACGGAEPAQDQEQLRVHYPQPTAPYQPMCSNHALAPHAWEGKFLVFGDIVAKSGAVNAARVLYENAMESPDYNSWAFREVLEQRLAQVEQRAALPQDADPQNDPLPWMWEGSICSGCHRG